MNNELGIAILSTSVALAGLLLVFLGFIFSIYKSFPPNTEAVVLHDYKISACSTFVAFILCIIDAILALLWLLNANSILQCATVAFFFLTIICVLLVAIITFILLIRR